MTYTGFTIDSLPTALAVWLLLTCVLALLIWVFISLVANAFDGVRLSGAARTEEHGDGEAGA
jgi:hypothetical protein